MLFTLETLGNLRFLQEMLTYYNFVLIKKQVQFIYYEN